jgi:rubredoxin-NAD+ reductase
LENWIFYREGNKVKRVVIIGTGLAGYSLAKEFRKLDSQSDLHFITKDDGQFYSKPMLSNALAKNKTAEDLVTTTADEMGAQLNATIWTRCAVKKIDIQHSVVVTADNKSVAFDKLVLALGASQIKPLLEGNAVDAILTINSLQDYAEFRTALGHARHVAIIGPGLIGCEFANDIAETGCGVTVIGPGRTPLNRLLPPDAGKAFQDKLTQLGVDWRLNVMVNSVDSHNDSYAVTLSSGEVVRADLVLSAIGLSSNIGLARSAGLRVNRGIEVNRLLETSAKNVYALGDCAEIEGMVLPFVLPIMHSARSLAQTLAGNPTQVRFPAMPVVVKTPAHSVVVSSPPVSAAGEWRVTLEEGGVRALFQDSENKLLGFVLTGSSVAEKQKLTKEMPAVLE